MQPIPNNFTPELGFHGNYLPRNQQTCEAFNLQMHEFDLGALHAQTHNGAYFGEASQTNYGTEFLAPVGYFTPPCLPQYMSPFSPAFSPMFQPFMSLPNSANLHPIASQHFPPDGDLVLPQSVQTIPHGGPFFHVDGSENNCTDFASDFKPILLTDPSAANVGLRPVATVASLLAPKQGHVTIETPSSILARDKGSSSTAPGSQLCDGRSHPKSPLAKEPIQQLQQKSNYCHIAEGTSNSLGLRYDASFEQQVKRKRQHHQKSEQQRRAAMAAKFKQLATTIYTANPNSQSSMPVSQSEILAATIQHIQGQKKQHSVQNDILLYLRNRFNIPNDSEDFPPLPATLPHDFPEKGSPDSDFLP